MPYDKSPMVLGNRVPYGRGSLEGAEPPYADGFPHGRVGPVTEGNPGEWVIVPAEAPYDGRYYVRQNRAWVITTFIDALPNDLANIYGRKRNLVGPDTWEMVIGEAPRDNRLYARENGIWVAFTSLDEAPVDIWVYGRSNRIWRRACEDILANYPGANWAFARRDGQWWVVPIDLGDSHLNGTIYGRVKQGETSDWVEVPGEAPKNTTLYGRQNGQWVPIAVGGIGEAPSDNRYYARFNTGWAQVPGEIPEGAPAGKTYGRSNQLWLETPRDVTVNTEGLVDGDYVRRKEGTNARWVSAPTLPAEPPVDATIYGKRGTPISDPVPRWVQIPVQEEAPIAPNPNDSNVFGRRNGQWLEVPEEAPNTGQAYSRRFHQWVPALTLPDAWRTIPIVQPAEWPGSELRYRVIGGSQIEFIGSLTPSAPIPGNGVLPRQTLGQTATNARPVTEQRVIVATQSGGNYSLGAIRIMTSGTVVVHGVGPIIDSLPNIHFTIALT